MHALEFPLIDVVSPSHEPLERTSVEDVVFVAVISISPLGTVSRRTLRYYQKYCQHYQNYTFTVLRTTNIKLTGTLRAGDQARRAGRGDAAGQAARDVRRHSPGSLRVGAAEQTVSAGAGGYLALGVRVGRPARAVHQPGERLRALPRA